MSLITRCPACGTMFKVVTDQLKVSQGWVRCGQCAEIFDAQLYLQAQPTAFQAAESSAGPRTSTVDAEGANAAVQPQQDLPETPNSLVATLATELVVQPSARWAAASAEADLEGETPAAAAAPREVSFVRDARRRAFWRRPAVRLVLAVSALSLACLLAVQVAVGQRDALLAFDARTKPWLQHLCNHLACDMGVPRRIESIVIDSSTFNKAEAKDSYRLTFALKNSSQSVVAMPTLEVALTDGQDQTLIRRVVSPAEFGAAGGALDAGAEFSSSVTLQVQPSSPPLKIAGYRLLVFYP